MAHWKITLLDEPKWDGRMFTYAGVKSTSSVVEFEDTVRDSKARWAFIDALDKAGAKYKMEWTRD